MKLKICGVQSVEDAEQLAALGVDYVGLNFVPTSPRQVDVKIARLIATSLSQKPTKVVALFQDESLHFIQEHVEAIEPELIQLHGSEPAEFVAQLTLPVIKAISVAPTDRAADVIEAIKKVPADYYLLDRAERGQGQIIDPALVRDVCQLYPDKVFLAGGLSSENLPGVLKVARPYAVDIAGGVRTDGELDFAKVRQVLEIVRSAA
jgi:phosphoribosylanthranilate isomerase